MELRTSSIRPIPPIGDNDAIGLFARKNQFMYSIFEAEIKTDMGISIVRSCETDRNAQTVWCKLVEHQTTSTVGALTRESLLAHLITFKLDTNTWRGTHVSFLVNFQDKIQEYERLTPVGDHYSDELKFVNWPQSRLNFSSKSFKAIPCPTLLDMSVTSCPLARSLISASPRRQLTPWSTNQLP
jgi:hypothetical protein